MRSSSVARRSSSRRLISGLQRLFVAQVGIRWTAPEGKTLAEKPAGLARVGLARSGAELLELVGVESPRCHTQQVSAGRRGQRLVSERSPKPRHVDLSRLGGRSRCALSPALARRVDPWRRARLRAEGARPGPFADGRRPARPRRRPPRPRGRRGRESARWPSARPYHPPLSPEIARVYESSSRLCSRSCSRNVRRCCESTRRCLRRPHPAARAEGARRVPDSSSFSPSPSSSSAQRRHRGGQSDPPTVSQRADGRLLPDGADIQHATPARAPTTVPTASRRAHPRRVGGHHWPTRWPHAPGRGRRAHHRDTGRHPTRVARPRSTGSQR